MTSHTSSSWDFEPIYQLIESFRDSQTLRDETPEHQVFPSSFPPRIPSPSEFDPKINVPQNLGDFNRLYEFLGLPTQEISARPEIESIEYATSSDPDNVSQESTHSTPPSSLPDTIQYEDFVNRKVRWTDETVEVLDPVEVKRRSRRDMHRMPHKTSLIKNSADFDTDTETETYRRRPMLVPSWVTPSKLWLPPISKSAHDPTVIQPIETLTIEEKRAKLLKKLRKSVGFGSDSTATAKKLHVFVDCSNIIIGFYNALKIKRGYDVKAYTRQAPFSWQSLATILERDRPVARRVVVGSHGSPDKRLSKLPDYMLEAESYGYELNVLDRVYKYKDPTSSPKKKKGGNGYATTSGHSSGSDGASMRLKVVAEQGVDELLHMKMLESLVDTPEPTTIVLASGDAAEAEYSGGFFKNVERALKKGWRVELVAWSSGLSREYRSPAFLTKWHDQFTIIELDDFSEELLALYTVPEILLA